MKVPSVHSLLQASVFALLSVEVVAKSTFMDQAVASGNVDKSSKDRTGNQKFSVKATDSPDYHCTADKKCSLGCCGPLDDEGNGICGMGPKFCGDGCTSTCDQKSECNPGWGMEWSKADACPLNVCCSEFGFCGTTSDFCGGKTVPQPSCDAGAGSANKRIIGYYEGWNYQRSCDTMKPDEIPLGYYTHINFAFALIHPTQFTIDAMDDKTGTLYKSVTSLKDRDPNLKVWIALGGWAFNDPGPTQGTFSLLSRAPAAQETFFNSLISFMENNGFDGVDIDWEYPAADDRGGSASDFQNFVSFIAKLRSRLNSSGKDYGLSLTLPSSYWYMQHFDIIHLEPYVDWFNVMTYDIHGVWDGNIPSLGAHVQSHTNLTEISLAMDLLWRNNINPERVTMGLGFYGRSFTLSDPSCTAPGCPFSEAGKPGDCTGTAGILSAGEIDRAIKAGGKMTLDEASAAQIVTFGGDQWVSFDDKTSLGMKQKWANQHCIGGLMVWAVDLDDGTLIDALFGNTGRKRGLHRDKNAEDNFQNCYQDGKIGGAS